MKIAVLIAGYIRTFDRTYLNLLEFIKLNYLYLFPQINLPLSITHPY